MINGLKKCISQAVLDKNLNVIHCVKKLQTSFYDCMVNMTT